LLISAAVVLEVETEMSTCCRSADDDCYLSLEHQTLCAQSLLSVLQQSSSVVHADDLTVCKVQPLSSVCAVLRHTQTSDYTLGCEMRYCVQMQLRMAERLKVKGKGNHAPAGA